MALNTSFFTQQLRRELSGKHRGSSPLWILFQPLLLLAVYSFVFTEIFQARAPAGNSSFVVFLALGYWPWSAFSEAVLRNLSVINEHAGLIKKVAIKRELLVVARVVAIFLLHMAGFAAVLLALAISGQSIEWLYLPVALIYLLVLAALALGLGLMLGAAQVIVPSLQHFIQPLMLLVFFSTPILWGPQMLPEKYQVLLNYNPLAWWVSSMRLLLLDGQLPQLAWVLKFCVGTGLVLWLGHWVFRRLSIHFEDYL